MNITVYLPFVASILIGLAGPVVARRARPAVGATTLAAIVAIGAIGTLWATALLAATFIDDVPLLARSVGPIPVPDGVALVALVALAIASVRLVGVLRRRRRLYARIHDVIADLEPVDSDVIVIADARPDAFAVPGRGPALWRRYEPRIVLTEGMLAALDNGQKSALLAHERAHLRAGHHRLRAAADLAAAANPLLIPARNTVGFLCERWADERAVADVGSRRLVANAIATAALAQASDARTTAASRQVALGFNHCGTVDRVAALHRPPASALRAVTVLALAAGVCILAADVNATGELLEIVRRLI
jgi:beta-lactamase regulating signal transducer with metallopeptidase domain